MDRREFLRSGAAATGAAMLPGVAEAAPRRRPNVLYAFSDQHRAVSLPGEPFNAAEAPVLDRFRRANLSMDRCISNYPLCVPHRAILMSGRYSFQTGVTGNGDTLEPRVPGLGDVFRTAGYHTGYVGKWHLYHGENEFVPPGPYRFGFADWHAWAQTNKHYDGITFDQVTGERVVMPGYQPVRMTDQAITFLNGQKGSATPWMLVVSWNPPHPPYDPPPAQRDRYDPAKLQFRPNVRMPTPADEIVNPYPQLQSMETLRRAEQGYYGGITAIDGEFGRLLAALEANGQAEDTIVVYTSDHGEMMGSHGHMAKQMPHEESCRVPFFVRVPGARGGGRSSEALFSSIDLYPTMCGLAGIGVPGHCSGRDFSPLLRGEGGFAEPEMVFLMNQKGPPDRQEVDVPTYRGVRTRTHTYAVQMDGRWCLYDNMADPFQQRNLVREPGSAALMQQMDAALVQWSTGTGDPFPYGQVVGRFSAYPGT